MVNINPNFLNQGQVNNLANAIGFKGKQLPGLSRSADDLTPARPSGSTQVQDTPPQADKLTTAAYRGWGRVQQDIQDGKLNPGDHFNYVQNGRMYRFVVTQLGPNSYSAMQVPFDNGRLSVGC